MVKYLNGEKLLTESDLPPQWNLLTGTADFSGNWENAQPLGSETFNGAKTMQYNSVQWLGIGQKVLVQPGPYIFSLMAKAITEIKGQIHWFINILDVTTPAATVDDKYNPNNKVVTVSNNWQRIYTTFFISSSGYINPRIESDSSQNNILLAQFKLERGTIATPWMPAISDLALKSNLGG